MTAHFEAPSGAAGDLGARHLVPAEVLPHWLRPLHGAVATGSFSAFEGRPRPGDRGSAVLVLFGEGPDGPDVLLIERADTLRDHAGQPAFPGGRAEDGDDGPVATALREAAEETGVDPRGVVPFAVLAPLWLSVTGYAVTPVLAWWRSPGPVRPVDSNEVAAVVRVPLRDLADPARRGTWVHPAGRSGPAFEVGGLVVWGFTAGVLDGLVGLAGLTRPWDPTRTVALPPGSFRDAARSARTGEVPPT